MTYVLIYLATLLLVWLWYRFIKAVYLKMLYSVYRNLEGLFSRFHEFLRENKSSIYKYNKSLSVLFANKKKFLSERRISASTIASYIPLFDEDISFLDQFVWQDVVFSYRLRQVSWLLQFIEKIKRSLHLLLLVLTLGIGQLLFR